MKGNPIERVEVTMPDEYSLVFMDGSLTGIYPQANELWYIEIRTPQGLPHTEANLTPKGSARAEIDPRTAPDLIRAYHDHDQEGAWSI